MNRVINFSGGETSAYLTIQQYLPGDAVLFCDTGREHSETYEFIKRFEIHEHIPVIKLHLPNKWEGFLEKWNHGKSLPNRGMRECTLELKVRTARRWCRKNIGMAYVNMIGFRADEKHRVVDHVEKWQQVTTSFPLYEMGITKPMINEFWEGKEYRLMIPKILGNCDLCFMKGEDAIIKILTNFPELADKWIADEESIKNIHGHRYVKKMTMRQMRDVANKMASEGKRYDLTKVQPKLNCACTA